MKICKVISLYWEGIFPFKQEIQNHKLLWYSVYFFLLRFIANTLCKDFKRKLTDEWNRKQEARGTSSAAKSKRMCMASESNVWCVCGHIKQQASDHFYLDYGGFILLHFPLFQLRMLSTLRYSTLLMKTEEMKVPSVSTFSSSFVLCVPLHTIKRFSLTLLLLLMCL